MPMVDAKVEKGQPGGTERTPGTWSLLVTAVSTRNLSPQGQLTPSQSILFPAS